MKIIDKIVQQPTPPKGNVLWDDGETLRIKRGGVFESIGGSSGAGKMMEEVTYSELVKLRDEGKLIAGQMYRMTDYETYCGWTDTECAGHPFDLVLTALDEKTLDEKCSAIWSERDTDGYFASSNLPAWDVRYCLDNDTDRFDWAVKAGKFVTANLKLLTGDDFIVSLPIKGTLECEGETFIKWGPLSLDGMELYVLTESDNPSINDFIYVAIEQDGEWYAEGVSDDCILGVTMSDVNGKGVIYRLVDELENSIPYDFKNIKFYNKDYAGGVFQYTIAADILDGTMVYPDWCTNNYFSKGCKNNIIYCGSYNTLGEGCQYNIFNEDATYITLGKHCSYNIIGMRCGHISLGAFCKNNVFGQECFYNTLGNECCENAIGNYSCDNTFGNGCCQNTMIHKCLNNSFGDNCSRNILDMNVYRCSFGYGCQSNQINHGNGHSFGKNCTFNSCGGMCNTFCDNCSNNTLGASSYCILELGCENVSFIDEKTSASTIAYYYHLLNVHQGNIPVKSGITCITYVTSDKDGELVQYTVDDIINK